MTGERWQSQHLLKNLSPKWFSVFIASFQSGFALMFFFLKQFFNRSPFSQLFFFCTVFLFLCFFSFSSSLFSVILIFHISFFYIFSPFSPFINFSYFLFFSSGSLSRLPFSSCLSFLALWKRVIFLPFPPSPIPISYLVNTRLSPHPFLILLFPLNFISHFYLFSPNRYRIYTPTNPIIRGERITRSNSILSA